ncbi:hypothetical protein [Qipengyuania atrilutea]|uniref:Sugar transporter n=1 Tax=Qipengyuania atrilutea TaxID=2744473 RepID=A0A850H5B7_9SPHN|nr:hypothetical protein [Actirhodobacter atriluteus]NVD45856.1 hypothetical protein [Actirhodobacter atriluteus]
MNELARAKTPWHLWVVGIMSLLWNGFGANDYTQTQLSNLDYMRTMMDGMGVTPEAALAYFQSFPAWVDAFWAFGVWGSLAGSVLLLLRSRWAIIAFGSSLIGLAGTTIYQAISETPAWASSGMAEIMSIVIWAIVTFLLIYAISMRQKGVLR